MLPVYYLYTTVYPPIYPLARYGWTIFFESNASMNSDLFFCAVTDNGLDSQVSVLSKIEIWRQPTDGKVFHFTDIKGLALKAKCSLHVQPNMLLNGDVSHRSYKSWAILGKTIAQRQGATRAELWKLRHDPTRLMPRGCVAFGWFRGPATKNRNPAPAVLQVRGSLVDRLHLRCLRQRRLKLVDKEGVVTMQNRWDHSRGNAAQWLRPQRSHRAASPHSDS